MNTHPSKIRLVVFLFLAFLLSGCNQQGRKAIPTSTRPKSQTMVISTYTPRPAMPTNTPQSIFTPSPKPSITPQPTFTPSPAPTNTPLATQTPAVLLDGKIAFVRSDGNGYVISIMNPDGSGVMNATTNARKGYDLDWSPDSRKIAFDVFNNSSRDIFVMDGDGSNEIQLTDDPADEREPSWSPDGMQIAFVSESDHKKAIYLINVDGSDQKLLVEGNVDLNHPDWSPDGSQIIYSNNGDIVLYDLNDAGQKILTGSERRELNPTWSPDGKSIAYISFDMVKSQHTLMVMKADGSNPKQIVGDEYGPNQLTWSPDGKWLAFWSGRPQYLGIHKIEASGDGKPIFLTEGIFDAEDPAWGAPEEAIYGSLAETHAQQTADAQENMVNLIPKIAVPAGLFDPEVNSSTTQYSFVQGDWGLLPGLSGYIALPLGWSVTAGSDVVIEFSFDPGENGKYDHGVIIESGSIVTDITTLTLDQYLDWFGINTFPLSKRTNTVILNTDSTYRLPRAYRLFTFKDTESGKDSVALCFVSREKFDDFFVIHLLLVYSSEDDWSQYYPIYREVIAHWSNYEFEKLGAELPEVLAP